MPNGKNGHVTTELEVWVKGKKNSNFHLEDERNSKKKKANNQYFIDNKVRRIQYTTSSKENLSINLFYKNKN